MDALLGSLPTGIRATAPTENKIKLLQQSLIDAVREEDIRILNALLTHAMETHSLNINGTADYLEGTPDAITKAPPLTAAESAGHWQYFQALIAKGAEIDAVLSKTISPVKISEHKNISCSAPRFCEKIPPQFV